MSVRQESEGKLSDIIEEPPLIEEHNKSVKDASVLSAAPANISALGGKDVNLSGTGLK